MSKVIYSVATTEENRLATETRTNSNSFDRTTSAESTTKNAEVYTSQR